MHTLNFPKEHVSKTKTYFGLLTLVFIFLIPQAFLLAQDCECSLNFDADLPKVSLTKIGEDLAGEDAWTKIRVSLDKVVSEDVRIRLHYGGTAVQDRDFEGPSNILVPAGQQSVDFSIQHIDASFHAKDFDLTVFILKAENAVFNPDMLRYQIVRKGISINQMGEVIIKVID